MSLHCRLLLIGMGLWVGGAYSSEAKEEEESYTYMTYMNMITWPARANKQEAEEQHKQRVCDITFYWKRHYSTSSVHYSQKFISPEV